MQTFMQDILVEPEALRRSLKHTVGDGYDALRRGAEIVRDAKLVYITGIGSSWHAGMAVQSLFDQKGRPAVLIDASELLHFTQFAKGSCLIVLSRSGRSVEIVKLIDKAEAAGTPVLAVTNTLDSPLANRAAVVLPMRAAFDRNVSVTMYSALTLVGGLLAAASLGESVHELTPALDEALAEAERAMDRWRDDIEGAAWIASDLPTYFLSRGGSMASCSETRLLWEEAAKTAATSMTTGGFRHGPQEILAGGLRIGMWVMPKILRAEDLNLANDLREHGALTLLIGQDLPRDSADLVLSVPTLAAHVAHWQFLIDIIPAQLASAAYARFRGANSDEFIFCPYVIEAEGGLTAAGSRA